MVEWSLAVGLVGVITTAHFQSTLWAQSTEDWDCTLGSESPKSFRTRELTIAICTSPVKVEDI